MSNQQETADLIILGLLTACPDRLEAINLRSPDERTVDMVFHVGFVRRVEEGRVTRTDCIKEIRMNLGCGLLEAKAYYDASEYQAGE